MNDIKNTISLVRELRDRTSLGLADCKKALEQSNNNIDAAIDLLKQWGELKGKEKENRVATEGVIANYFNVNRSIEGLVEINCETDFTSKSQGFKDFVDTVCDVLQKKETIEFETKRKELIAKTGENIVVRRNETWVGHDPYSVKYCYTHSSNLASMVEITTNKENFFPKELFEFLSDVALQVAAMAPLVISKDSIYPDLIDRQKKIFEAQLTEDKKPIAAWPKIIEGKFTKWRKDIVLLEQESIKDPKRTIDQIRNELSKKLDCEIKINRFVRYALGEGVEKNVENFAEEVIKLIGDKNE